MMYQAGLKDLHIKREREKISWLKQAYRFWLEL